MRCQPLGHIGIATSGTAIYSWFPAQVKFPDVKDFEELDICEGHPSPDNQYHYHYYSPCVQMPVCGVPSPIFGVAIDGIPIYGLISEEGVQMTSETLYECVGRTDNEGRYKYHKTIDPTYLMSCFRGESRSDLGKDDHDFVYACPYDDRVFIRSGPDKMKDPERRRRPPTHPHPADMDVCTKSKNHGTAPMACTDKEWLKKLDYKIGYEWKRQTKEITLLPCCPEGETWGDSCKTADGVKDVCVQEKKTVQYLTRLPKEKFHH